MFVTILTILAAVVVALLIYAATRPPTFTVQRSATIGAPPDRVFAYLDDFHRWPAWSPWERLDPEMQRVFSGAEHGKGAAYAWSGNKKVGEGRMEILESQAPSRVFIQLDFLKPFEAHNTTEFTLDPGDGGTRLNWAMHGNHNFVSKLMSVFMNMDKMVGSDFERGLANLKTVAETEASEQPAS